MRAKMASAASKRKQDDKHLKMLRELVALAHNKTCFDCHQRGPTYCNMTVGSFVCTSCSGILRGLNPPHRVKSISMTTFTPEEMDFLKSRLNEFCRKVWLSRFNPQVHREPDSKDEHKVRDFMSDKYEKKRFYTEPLESMHEEARVMNTPASKADVKPLRNIVGNSLPSLKVQTSQPPVSTASTARPHLPGPPASSTSASPPQPTVQPMAQPAPQPLQQPAPQPAHQPTLQPPKPSSAFDLLGDIGGDPFASPAAQTKAQPAATGGFADFSAFNSSGAPQAAPPPSTPTFPTGPGLLQPMNTGGGASSSAGGAFPTSAPPATTAAAMSDGDKYAALASLDNVFGGGGPNSNPVNWDGSVPGGPVSGSSGWGGGAGGGYSSGGGPAPAVVTGPTATSASNPFGAGQHAFGGVSNTGAAPAGNPFLAGGGGGGAGGGGFPPQQPGIQQYSQMSQGNSGGFAQYTMATSAPVNAMPGMPTSQFGVQNGGFGTNLATAYGMPPHQQQQVAGGGFGGVPQGMPQGQFRPAAQAPGAGQFQAKGGVAPGVPQQQFGVWPGQQQQAGNPFMSPAGPQQVPPRGSTNPFL